MTYTQPMYEPPQPPRPRRSNGPLLAVVIVLAVLLCGGSGVAGVLLVDQSGQPDDPTTTPSDYAGRPPTERPTERPSERPSGPPSSEPDGGGGRDVVYEVTGEGPATIVYVKADGLTVVQESDAELPWRLELTLEDTAAVATVTATRGLRSSGTVNCRLTIDGKEVAKKSASGNFATATCTKLVLPG
ncbi:MmpS family transport accessory protein [Micromonospora sp. CPCC 206061]|uniref:MmpS family transport accessory protein n=1 Tax=Micromonospora sp. CPCC 206061 TaxID=3122410 RepID=UPI002FF1B29A